MPACQEPSSSPESSKSEDSLSEPLLPPAMKGILVENQSRSIILGLALGDSLGWPTEFLSRSEIQSRWGSKGIQDLPVPAIFTDDTQMTIAIAEALCALPNGSTSEIMVEVARNFISWRDSPENNRAPGLTCMSSVARLARGVPWDEAGSPNSKGCGAVMRVAPIGFLYQHRPEKLRGLATATALSTHAHPTALASACAAAYLIKLALDEVPLDSWIERTVDFVGKGSREISAKLRQVEAVLSLSSEETAMDQLGHGWVAEEAVALALYCVMRNPDSWLECVRRGANSPGDSDSIASIAGGIQAARLGLSAIPQNWQIAIERHQYLLNLSARLAKAKLQL